MTHGKALRCLYTLTSGNLLGYNKKFFYLTNLTYLKETASLYSIQLFQLRLPTSKAEKSNTSAKGCWESLCKFINLLAIPSSLSRSYSIFPLCSWTTLIEIAVYNIHSRHPVESRHICFTACSQAYIPK